MEKPTGPNLTVGEADARDRGQVREAGRSAGAPVDGNVSPGGTRHPDEGGGHGVELVVLLASAIVGSNLFGVRQRGFGSARLAAATARVAPLGVTIGSLNFAVAPDIDPTSFKSVVIGCRLVNSAYSGVCLMPAQ